MFQFHKFGFWLLALFILNGDLIAQPVRDYKLGGASRPSPEKSLQVGKQYKRVHQRAFRKILQNEIKAAESFLTKYLKAHAHDEETEFMLGVLNCRKGDLATAQKFFSDAIKDGLPKSRIIAGPRSIIASLAGTEFLERLFAEYRHQAVHGPLIGNMTSQSAQVWVRTAKESEVAVVLTAPNGKQLSAKANSQASEDFTAVVDLSGLRPNQKYKYQLRIDGKVCVQTGVKSFRTFVPPGTPSRFSIAFGGGAGFVPENEKMWDTIGEFNPNAILLLGDNVYIDDPESEAMQQYTYHRRQSRPEWQRLTARVPVYTIWDDHDFSTNDSWGGADIDIPFWKKEYVWPVFRQNWANPGYGEGEAHPGCWYDFQIADVHFIMLDCRYYRTNPKGEPKSMLGPFQLQWLKRRLKQSNSKFKVLCSSVPWDFRTKGGSRDTWNGYKQEREEVFRFIERNKVEGVVLLSADRHRSDAWKISRDMGYDFYEFNSSRLTNQHVHPRMEKRGAIFSYNRLQSFGFVTFDTTLDDPTVKYEVISIDGERQHSISVKLGQLKY